MSEEKDVAEMKKDDLAEYALSEHAVELDMTKPVKTLREEVAALDDKKAGKDSGKKSAEKPAVKAAYLRHPDNGRVYPATKALLARGDMSPCDENGNSL